MTSVALRDEAYDAPVVQVLVQEMADDLARYYGPGTYPPQDPARWAPPEGLVLVAEVDGQVAGCGAFVRAGPATAELKRMYTRPAHRRQGVAAAILDALERRAFDLGYRRVVLETGVPQVDAQALYRRSGYEQVPCWPPHDTDPTSVCFARDLAPPGLGRRR